MRVIMTGGGTGGHIYPAVAIADEIKRQEPDSEILFIGSPVGLEKDIIPKAGYDIKLIPAMWIDRSNPLRIVNTGVTNLRGIHQAKKIIKNFNPDVVIGTGGYVCFPVIFAAHSCKVPCYIHEQNAFPGVANKSLERYVETIFMGFPEASHYFKQPEKHVVTGNPVRKDFYDVDKLEARKRLNIDPEDFVIFSFGGSQGAKTINTVMFGLLEKMRGTEHLTVLFGTGAYYYEELTSRAEAEGIALGDKVRMESYIDNMPDYLAAADLVVGRSGALSVAEICISGCASVLVPSPNVTGNHQYFNAKSVADRGGCILIEEADFTAERLVEEVSALMEEPQRIEEMSKISLDCVPRNSTELIYDKIKEGK